MGRCQHTLTGAGGPAPGRFDPARIGDPVSAWTGETGSAVRTDAELVEARYRREQRVDRVVADRVLPHGVDFAVGENEVLETLREGRARDREHAAVGQIVVA